MERPYGEAKDGWRARKANLLHRSTPPPEDQRAREGAFWPGPRSLRAQLLCSYMTTVPAEEKLLGVEYAYPQPTNYTQQGENIVLKILDLSYMILII